MSREILIDPVTRIEGHAKITIHLDDRGQVADARLHITQFRGFEKLIEGRPFNEMPSLMARICGICPVSHMVASAKACDALMAVKVPVIGEKLRRIMNLAQIVQSHALSFFHLASPDLLLGLDSDPAKRNIFGVLEAHPEIARDGIRLRQFGQQIIELLGGKRIHPAWIVPGGVSEPLSPETRDRILSTIPEAIAAIERALAWYKSSLLQWADEAASFGDFRSAFMALVNADGNVDHYDGFLRVMDADGNLLADRIDPTTYTEYLGEAVEPSTYLKSTYWKALGYPQGVYRVGPLARVIVSDRMGTPQGQRRARRVPAATRPRARQLVPLSLRPADRHAPRCRAVRSSAGPTSSCPRSFLCRDQQHRRHRCLRGPEGHPPAPLPGRCRRHGSWANLVIATGHDDGDEPRGPAGRQALREKRQLTEPMLNRVEAVIRCFDPCLSCSTHALGEMALRLQLIDPSGTVLDELVALTDGIVVVGYGNSLRTDDGLGWHAAQRLTGDPRFAGTTILQRHQLVPELAYEISAAAVVVFIDATTSIPPGQVASERVRRASRPVAPGRTISARPRWSGCRNSSTDEPPWSTSSAVEHNRSSWAIGCRRWWTRRCRG